MPLEAGTRLGPYEVLAPLGAGGMGEVYRARDTRLERQVAIKVLPSGAASPQTLERFEREAKAIAALNHPGICAIYDVGISPVPYLVMELLEGDTLHARLARGRIDVAALVEIGLALADALAAAHAKGIVHRDLKPANIALTPRGPKILDFGLARIGEVVAAADIGAGASETLATAAALTDAGVTLGTVAYMSPEQLRGEPLDARTDLFSLGLVLYEMATGQRAFSGTTSAVTSAAILHEQPTAPRELRPDLPARLEHAILTLLEKDRDVRTQTASELRAELTRIKREVGGARASDSTRTAVAASEVPTVGSGSAPMSTVAPPPSSSDAQLVAGLVRRHRGAVLGAAAVVLLAVAGTAYVLVPRSSEGSPSDAARLSITDLQLEVLTTSGTASSPAVSPDGNYVAYREVAGNQQSLRVRQVSTDSNVEIVKPEPGVELLGPTVTPDGAFVNYVRRVVPQPPELWQVPFLGGTSRRLLPGIGGRVGFSRDGRQMAFVRSNGPQSELVVVASDGSGERIVSSRRQPEFYMNQLIQEAVAPAWSPDARTIATLGGSGGGGQVPSGQVVFVDVETGAERTVRISSAPTPGSGLAWLDDATLLVSSAERSTAPIQLWLLAYPRGEVRRLTNDREWYIGPSLTADKNVLVAARNEASFSVWTSDARREAWSQTVPTTVVNGPIGFRLQWNGSDFLFLATATGGSFAITRWRAEARATETLIMGGANPSVGRDGSTIVYNDFDTGEWWKADASGRNRALLGRNLGNPQLSPDGRLLPAITAGPKGPVLQVRSVNDPARARDVTSDRVRGGGAGGAGGAQISPDGRSIAFNAFNDRGQPAIAVCDLDTCSSRKVLPPLARWRWIPDGQALAYVDPRTLSDLWSQPIDGGPPRQLTHFAGDGHQIWDFDWSADGTRLAVARGRIVSDIVLFRGLRRSAR